MKKIELLESPCSDLQKRVADGHKDLNIKLFFSLDGKKTFAKCSSGYHIEINLENQKLTKQFISEDQLYNWLFFGSRKTVFSNDGKKTFLREDDNLTNVKSRLEECGISNDEKRTTVDNHIANTQKFIDETFRDIPFDDSKGYASTMNIPNDYGGFLKTKIELTKVRNPEAKKILVGMTLLRTLGTQYILQGNKEEASAFRIPIRILQLKMNTLKLDQEEKTEIQNYFSQNVIEIE